MSCRKEELFTLVAGTPALVRMRVCMCVCVCVCVFKQCLCDQTILGCSLLLFFCRICSEQRTRGLVEKR